MSRSVLTAAWLSTLLAALAVTATAAQEAPSPTADEAVAHEYFSDLPLVTHEGTEVRLSTLDGDERSGASTPVALGRREPGS